MAYCLRSFVETLEQVLYPNQHHKKWVLDRIKVPQVQSLLEIASFLRDFLDNSSPLIQEKIASLEDQIMDAAEKAEDSLESYITSQLVSNPESQACMISPPNLEDAIRALEDAKQEVIKIMDPCQRPDDNMLLPVSSSRYANSKNMVVGVTEDLNQLRSRLTSRASDLNIIPIVGMGGMGKTTLARILYDEFSSSKSYFDCLAWVTVSQTYDPQLIFKTLLESMHEKTLKHNDDLVVSLHKTLFGRRYLIVLDDIWSCKAWDDVKMAFPRDKKGSRIILTTRENILAEYVNSKCHEMHLMNEDDSWELIRGKVFGKECCPRVWEEVGKSIARSCGGLPLALQVIGGLLSQSQRNIDFWEHVAYNVRSLITETNDQFSDIFSWSFIHLPHYLKPCFLYMAGFPEDYVIPASKIIKLWISEGFLHPIRDKSLEEAAKVHLKALVDRNLIFVCARGKRGRAKSYGMHDLLRDLCLRKAREKKIVYLKELESNNLQEDLLFSGRIVTFEADNYLSTTPLLTPRTRSLRICSGSDNITTIPSCLCFNLSLLRVLDLVFICSYLDKFPEEILQLVNLRYLAIHSLGCEPVRFSVLRNLQTLIVIGTSSLTMISDLPHLRHLMFSEMEECSRLRYGIHENLRSLPEVPVKEVRKLLGKLPSLRKLTIGYPYSTNERFIDLTSFHNLENLKLVRYDYSFYRGINFPVSLEKVTLEQCRLSDSLLDAIGTLPNLQVLILFRAKDWTRIDWKPSEGRFCALRYLEIYSWRLVNWVATEVHFPVLEHLVLQRCFDLIEIPNDFGSIETLKIIEVSKCLPSVFDSATTIYEDQCQFGNTDLQLRLDFDIADAERLRKREEERKKQAQEKMNSKTPDFVILKDANWFSKYPDFEYNAEGGGGSGTATKTSENDILNVEFDVETLYIPPLSTATTKFLGLHLPPFLKIEIVPEVFRGNINKESGKVDLKFNAKFLFSIESIYRTPPLMVETILTSEESTGNIRSGRGTRLNQQGQTVCKLVGVATVQPINDLFMDTFLSLPTECLAELNAIIAFSPTP